MSTTSIFRYGKTMRCLAAAFPVALIVPVITASTAQATTVESMSAKSQTASIQALLDNPVNGTVNLPTGTFTIQPNLRLNSGEQIIGHNTTLRVAAHTGDYRAILSGATAGTNLSGLSITGVTFDQNTRENPVGSSAALFNGQPRDMILISLGSNIKITGDRFVGADNVDSIVTGGGTNNVTISSNVFRTTNALGHDHSSIYTSGSNTSIINNNFTGSSMFSSAAIEVHGNWVDVTGNHITGYPRGANIVASHTTFKGNKILGALNPVDLWSVDSPGLTDVTVSGNTLNRNLNHWVGVYRQHGASLPPPRYTQMVIRDESSTFPFQQITISSNTK
jgi:hypothetical protein